MEMWSSKGASLGRRRGGERERPVCTARKGPKIARGLLTDRQRTCVAECPGHELWARDFKGSSGLFSFELKDANAAARAAFVDDLALFGIGYSWGGYESLAIPVEPTRTVSQAPAPNLVRLHIGLEDVDDLIADLEHSLQQYRK